MSSLLRSIQYCVIMKARSLLKRGPNSVIQGPGFGGVRASRLSRGRGGAGGSRGVQGCLGWVQGVGSFGGKTAKNHEKTRKTLRNCVQEVPVGQMAQGTPFRCLPWPTPLFHY